MSYAFFDIHSHIHDKEFDEDRETLLKEMKEYGVGTTAIGTDTISSERAVALAEKNDHVYATVGLHPNHATEEIFSFEKYVSS